MKHPLTLKNALVFTVLLLGAFVWGRYLYSIFTSQELFRFVFTRHLFYTLQILLSTFIFLFIHATVTHNYSIKSILFYFLLSSSLVYFRFFHELHFFLRENGLYFDIFKTDPEKKNVVSFQYARVLILGITSCLIIGSFIFVQRNMKKLFLIIFAAVFFIFSYNVHLQVGRKAYKDYEFFLTQQFEIVLNNQNNYEVFCKNLGFDCYVLDLEEAKNFNLSKPSIVNRILEKNDTTEESNKIVREQIKVFLESNVEQKVLSESFFITDNLRATNYGFKKLPNNKLFILIDFKSLAYALDLYLIYYSLLTFIFMSFWISALIWTYKKHKHIKL